MSGTTDRSGISSGGNWIVDRVKTVDCLPDRGRLANIRFEHRSPGGAAANVLAALAKLGTPFPLSGFGVIGDDADGRYLQETYRALGVDVSGLVISSDAATSYTDVMNEESSGDRSFFHCRGANALFVPGHVPVQRLPCRIFHLGYVLLLDAMDQPDPECGTVAARLLRELRAAGIRTSLDVVSEQRDRSRSLVPLALPYVDYLVLNEVEAGAVTGLIVRRPDGSLDSDTLREAAGRLAALGSMEVLAIHMPEGCYLVHRGGQRLCFGSLQLPSGYIASTLGAGDAFCAGMLYGLHEGWQLADAARLGTCCGAAALSALGGSKGVRSLEETLDLSKRFPERPPPVD